MDIDFLIKAMKVLLSVLTLISILFKTISIWLNLGWHQTRIKKDRIESLEPILNGGVDWYKRENRLLIEEAFQYAYRKSVFLSSLIILKKQLLIT
jgi:UDP-N-acetylenolpyruvoylglucosamine reductase